MLRERSIEQDSGGAEHDGHERRVPVLRIVVWLGKDEQALDLSADEVRHARGVAVPAEDADPACGHQFS